jgi:hypothetical protein
VTWGQPRRYPEYGIPTVFEADMALLFFLAGPEKLSLLLRHANEVRAFRLSKALVMLGDDVVLALTRLRIARWEL